MTYDMKDLRERNQIVEVAEALVLEPRRSGSSFLARCPAHDDKGRPNLVIYPAGTVKCYRCGYHADVIGLVVKVKGLDSGDEKIAQQSAREILEWIIDLPDQTVNVNDGLTDDQRITRLAEILNAARERGSQSADNVNQD